MPEEARLRYDLRGLKCPLPVLKTRKRMENLTPGALIEIETTDPLAVIDIPHFCNEDGIGWSRPSRSQADIVSLSASGVANQIKALPRLRIGHSQFSTLTPGMRTNSRILLVTTISPSLRACAPICMS